MGFFFIFFWWGLREAIRMESLHALKIQFPFQWYRVLEQKKEFANLTILNFFSSLKKFHVQHFPQSPKFGIHQRNHEIIHTKIKAIIYKLELNKSEVS